MNTRRIKASSAAFALNDLKNRGLVYETDSGWTIYDRLFGVWLRQRLENVSKIFVIFRW